MARRWVGSADVAVDEATGQLCVRTGGLIEAKRVKIDASSDATAGNTIIPAVTGKRICVLAMCLMAADSANATFYSGPGDTGTAVSGPMSLSANGGFVIQAPSDPAMHWLETVEGQAMTLKLSTPVQVSGWLVYYEG